MQSVFSPKPHSSPKPHRCLYECLWVSMSVYEYLRVYEYTTAPAAAFRGFEELSSRGPRSSPIEPPLHERTNERASERASQSLISLCAVLSAREDGSRAPMLKSATSFSK